MTFFVSVTFIRNGNTRHLQEQKSENSLQIACVSQT